MAQKALVFSLDTEQFIQTDFTVKSPCQNVVRFNPVGNAFVTGGADGRMRVYQVRSKLTTFKTWSFGTSFLNIKILLIMLRLLIDATS